jgi:6-pyruvoyltetrahydropterin/6-carboxytetrahydropterin synthase
VPGEPGRRFDDPRPEGRERMQAITYLTRVVRFSAAHRYFRPEWSEPRNREVFGPCANPHGHGHNYVLEVMIAGTPDPATGFSVDLGELDRLLHEVVIAPLDHQHINHAVPEFAEGRLVPTTENLVVWLWERISAGLREGRLARLRLREEDHLFVDYFGPAGSDPGEWPPLIQV